MSYTPGHNDGRRVESIPRQLRPDPTQYRARRNAIWLSAIERGLPIATDGRLRPVDAHDIAELWNVTTRAVYYGIEAAVADRRAMLEAGGIDA